MKIFQNNEVKILKCACVVEEKVFLQKKLINYQCLDPYEAFCGKQIREKRPWKIE